MANDAIDRVAVHAPAAPVSFGPIAVKDRFPPRLRQFGIRRDWPDRTDFTAAMRAGQLHRVPPAPAQWDCPAFFRLQRGCRLPTGL